MVLEAAKDLMPHITIIHKKVSIVAFSHLNYDIISNPYQLGESISTFRGGGVVEFYVYAQIITEHHLRSSH